MCFFIPGTILPELLQASSSSSSTSSSSRSVVKVGQTSPIKQGLFGSRQQRGDMMNGPQPTNTAPTTSKIVSQNVNGTRKFILFIQILFILIVGSLLSLWCGVLASCNKRNEGLFTVHTYIFL
jgi:hypothetical protein